MFGQKTDGSNDPQNKNPKQGNEISKEDFSSIEKLPVFTMKKDLKSLSDPKKNQESSLNSDKINSSEEIIEKNEKSSPFLASKKITENPIKNTIPNNSSYNAPPLNQEDEKEKEESEIKITQETPKPEIKESVPQKSEKEETEDITLEKEKGTKPFEYKNEKIKITETPKKTSGFKKILTFIFILITLGIIGGGGYYFWTTRIISLPVPATENPEPTNTTPEVISEPQPKPEIVLSQTSPNYLIIDTTDKNAFETAIAEYANKVAQTNAGSLIEFIATDKENNPISFEIFAQNFNINLNPEILAQLNPSFSLYIYNYGSDKIRLGISILVKDSELLKLALEKNEPTLIQGLSPLIGNTDYQYPDNSSFSIGTYNEAEIRYFNISSPEEMAIDYSVYKNNLIIGTTKSVTYSILDRK